MIPMSNIDLLKPGTFIKTKGARDRVGLRKIVEVRNADTPYPHLLVDHYQWVLVSKEVVDGKIRRKFRAKRSPYASEVLADKVIRIYTLDDTLMFVKEEKFKFGE